MQSSSPDTDSIEKPPKTPSIDRPFDPWRFAVRANARELVQRVLRDVLQHETRKRKRKEVDRRNVERTVEAVVTDLAHLHLLGYRERIALALDNNAFYGRYSAEHIGVHLRALLEVMANPPLDLIEVEGGSRYANLQTAIRPTERFLALLDEHRITLDDMDRDGGDDEEVIILRTGRSDDFWDDEHGKLVAYEDTADTRNMRTRVRAINRYLRGADITFLGGGGKLRVDPKARRLRRYFRLPHGQSAVSFGFDRGGRLYGGFWQTLKKAHRGGIRIDRQPTVTLDYGQTFPRLLYARLGERPPGGDLYTLPGLKADRTGVKRLLPALLFADKPIRRFPKGVREHFPKKTGVHDVIEALCRAHPALVGSFQSGVGHELMFEESQILLTVLERLREKGVIALPIHDAVIVAEEAAQQTQAVMREVFEAVSGGEAVVNIDGRSRVSSEEIAA